jgi:hypothetical protein
MQPFFSAFTTWENSDKIISRALANWVRKSLSDKPTLANLWSVTNRDFGQDAVSDCGTVAGVSGFPEVVENASTSEFNMAHLVVCNDRRSDPYKKAGSHPFDQQTRHTAWMPPNFKRVKSIFRQSSILHNFLQ